jgi:hypothetical protein
VLRIGLRVVAALAQQALHGRNCAFVIGRKSGAATGQAAGIFGAAVDFLGRVDALRFFKSLQKIRNCSGPPTLHVRQIDSMSVKAVASGGRI